MQMSQRTDTLCGDHRPDEYGHFGARVFPRQKWLSYPPTLCLTKHTNH